VLADILACAPGALAATKALMAKARWTPAALVDEAAALFSRAASGPRRPGGHGAFLQKRKPTGFPHELFAA
jgi:isohexenylglutaconyl-CoA hydratase